MDTSPGVVVLATAFLEATGEVSPDGERSS